MKNFVPVFLRLLYSKRISFFRFHDKINAKTFLRLIISLGEIIGILLPGKYFPDLFGFLSTTKFICLLFKPI